MRLWIVATRETRSHRFNLSIIDPRRLSVEGEHPYYTRKAEDLLPLMQVDASENIAGEDRSLKDDLTIFPATWSGNQWQKGLNRSRLELLGDPLFVTWLSRKRVPVWPVHHCIPH
jgi:hypothetical protein